MGLQINWEDELIEITSPTTDVDAQTLHDFIEDAMATPVGTTHADILLPEGKIEDPNNPGVFSQIIILLNSPWQIQFWGGSGYTRIYGGKIVGGLLGQPFKATGTAGDITVLESPVDGVTVVSGSGITQQDKDDIVNLLLEEPTDDHDTPNTVGAAIRDLSHDLAGEWKLDTSNNQMVLYRPGGAEMLRFDLFDALGAAAWQDIVRRVPV
jgi:hypothetical protein